MNLKLFLALCFCIFQKSYAQHTSFEVEYSEKMVKNPIDTSDVKSDDYKMVMFKKIEEIKKTLGNITYILKGNEIEALFTYKPFMENDANPNLMSAIMLSSADGKFYTNRSENLNFWQIESHDGKYYRLIEKDKTSDWKITKETKKIGDYDCYKATKKVLLNNRLPIMVSAWFTPEIPFSFGPKGYGGLPGLILALDERGFYFYADSVKISDESLQIKKPERGKLIKIDEYQKATKYK